MFYDIEAQINNLYNMHTRSAGSSNSNSTGDMSRDDYELIRDRINILKEKAETLNRTFD